MTNSLSYVPYLMGGLDRGRRVDVMGGADRAPRVDVMGGHDPARYRQAVPTSNMSAEPAVMFATAA